MYFRAVMGGWWLVIGGARSLIRWRMICRVRGRRMSVSTVRAVMPAHVSVPAVSPMCAVSSLMSHPHGGQEEQQRGHATWEQINQILPL